MKYIVGILVGLQILLLTGCMTQQGSSIIEIYNSKGMKLNDNRNVSTDNGSLDTVILGSCQAFPGATIVIKDVKTGNELIGKSPHKCFGKEPFSIPPFMPLSEIKFNNLNYKVAYKGSDKTRSIHEYTANNEPIENWTTLLTVFYVNDTNNKLEEFIALSNKNARIQPYSIKLDEDIGYVQTIFTPYDKINYFETSLKKIFRNDKCKGIVVFSYAKKYSSNIDTEIIKNENNKMLQLLERDTWKPVCE